MTQQHCRKKAQNGKIPLKTNSALPSNLHYTCVGQWLPEQAPSTRFLFKTPMCPLNGLCCHRENFWSMIFISRAYILYRWYDACAVTFVYSSVDKTRLSETTCVTRAMLRFRFRELFSHGIKEVREWCSVVRKFRTQTLGNFCDPVRESLAVVRRWLHCSIMAVSITCW